jgi:hypothetical protein
MRRHRPRDPGRCTRPWRRQMSALRADNEIAKYHWDVVMRPAANRGRSARCSPAASAALSTGSFPGPVTVAWRAICSDPSPSSRLVPPDYSQPAERCGNDHPGEQGVHRGDCIAARPGHPGPPGRAGRVRSGFTSLLLTLQRVPDVFDEAFRPHRLRIPALPNA